MADVLEEFSADRRSGPGGRGYEAQEPGKFEKPDIRRPPNPDLPEFNENQPERPNRSDDPPFGDDVADRPEPDEGDRPTHL